MDAQPQNPAAAPPKWRGHPNLARRPPAPAKGNGYVQRMARRALLVLQSATTPQILVWTRCRGPIRPRDYRTARRALEQIGAVRVGRAGTIGRPWIWELR
jgi:hypothetical protein